MEYFEPMTAVAIATSSQIAADAGALIAEAGGNAVDAAIAALLVSTVTEPGIVALGGGSFVTVWPPDGRPATIDGYAEMPGRGLPADRFGEGVEVYLEYGGGLTTIVGHGSMATPGTLAALELASKRYGGLPWRVLFEPAGEHAREGFPLSQASYNYLIHSHELIYGWQQPSFAALHDVDGELLQVGEIVRIEHLADCLLAIAEEGAAIFYKGEIGKMIAEDSLENGGILTRDDLVSFEPIARASLNVPLGEWHLATNPPPAIGGAVLSVMLRLMGERRERDWTAAGIDHLIQVQRAVFEYRFGQLDLSEDLERDVGRLLEESTLDELRRRLSSPSTVHTSTVDSSGLACSISSSTGYGAGVMPPGTGLWMNNFLGELELNRRGYHAWPPGVRLPSNMAPSVARRADGAALAIGSPGADRITTALSQVLVNFLDHALPLPEAVAHPRLHVEYPEGGGGGEGGGEGGGGGRPRVAYERGLPVGELDIDQRRFDDLSMFFGGVSAALWDPRGGFTVASDPRRQGGNAIR
ncbi:MAG: gamma-glutamyltransferase [Gemmatimonadota bacterium]